MKNYILIITSLLITVPSLADIVCEGISQYGGAVKVTVSDYKVTIQSDNLSSNREFTELEISNGLITANGLAVHFSNHFGCIRNATIISDFREPIGAGYMEVVKIGTCSGGSTSDKVCGI